MNLQPSTQNRLYQHAVNIELSAEQQNHQTAASVCDDLLSSLATTASVVGGILGIAAGALQIKNPNSPAGSLTDNTAIAAVVGNIMALVGTGIVRDSENDIGASPLFARTMGVMMSTPATVTNAMSLANLMQNPGMVEGKEHSPLTTAALALTGLATLINIGRVLLQRQH